MDVTHREHMTALFERALVVLGPDSGPLHLAAAVGTPIGRVFRDTAIVSVRAIVPLALMLLLVVPVVLRHRLPWRDEALLGVLLCIAGMTLFTVGVDIGLQRLGAQSGENLPRLYQATERTHETVILQPFDPSMVFESVAPDGSHGRYFLLEGPSGPTPVPYLPDRYDAASGAYLHVPRSRPRLPGAGGWIALLLVGLGLGFTTTLIEPAVGALGITMENVTVGVFVRRRFVVIVSAGVGAGTMAGFAMLAWSIPLAAILGPLYVVILVLTMVSSELFAGIAWDAGGATTASITVTESGTYTVTGTAANGCTNTANQASCCAITGAKSWAGRLSV